jgi:hypothetical protein
MAVKVLATGTQLRHLQGGYQHVCCLNHQGTSSLISLTTPWVLDRLWNVMTHTQKPDFVFQRNGLVHLNRRGASVQSTTGSRGVRVSGSNAGYTMFRDSVKSTGYPLHSPVSPSLPSRASSYAITFQLDSTYFLTYLLTFLLTYLLTYSLHTAQSFLRS